MLIYTAMSSSAPCVDVLRVERLDTGHDYSDRYKRLRKGYKATGIVWAFVDLVHLIPVLLFPVLHFQRPQMKFFPSHFGHRATIISDLWPSARHHQKLQDHGHGASVLRGVPVYSPAHASTIILHGDKGKCVRATCPKSH